MHVYGNVDHNCKTYLVDTLIYTCIWHEGSGRCEILDDCVLHDNVAVQGEFMRLFVQSYGIWTNCSMDRNVCRLDSESSYLYSTVYKRKMGGA